VTGLATAFGSGAMTNSIEDIAEDARAYFIIGSNTTENHPVIGMRIRQAVKQRGAKLVVADPRRIPITDLATLHLRQRPGTDIALLNGIMHVLIAEDLYDKEYVAQRTEGLEALQALVARYTPEVVEGITRVPAADIRSAARILGANRPCALLYAMGITQHTSGHQNVLSCANLQMLLGNMGVRGGGVNPLRGQNNVQGACDMGCLVNYYPGYQRVMDEAAQAKFAQAWGKTGSTKVGLTVVEMLNAADKGAIKGMFIMGENPAMTEPDANHARHALGALDFLVVQEILPSETTEYASVILPGVTFAEKDGTFTNTERRVQRVRQALTPYGQGRADWQILADLAQRVQKRMGAAPQGPYAGWGYASAEEIMREVAAVTPSYGGMSWARVDARGLQWPCPTADHPGTPVLHVGRFSRGLGMFSAVEWLPPAEQPDEEYPLVLTTGRVLYHFHGGTMTRRVAGLEEIYPEALVEIHPLDAQSLAVEDGDMVRVTSRRGQIVAKAQVIERTVPGVVFTTFHFQEAAANLLTIAALDPVAKIPEYKACAVRVERVEKAR
jgi:formate dehydrogenase alpha subunit